MTFWLTKSKFGGGISMTEWQDQQKEEMLGQEQEDGE